MMVVLLFLLGLFIAYKMFYPRDTEEYFLTFVMGSVIGAFIAAITYAGVFWFGHSDHKIATPAYPLVALVDNTGTSGDFFLASGTLGQEPTLSYYHVRDGYKTGGQVKARQARIFDSDEATVQGHYIDEKIPEFFAWPFPASYRAFQYTEFHIPPGSITSDVELDLR